MKAEHRNLLTPLINSLLEDPRCTWRLDRAVIRTDQPGDLYTKFEPAAKQRLIIEVDPDGPGSYVTMETGAGHCAITELGVEEILGFLEEAFENLQRIQQRMAAAKRSRIVTGTISSGLREELRSWLKIRKERYAELGGDGAGVGDLLKEFEALIR